MKFEEKIRVVPNFPKDGISFKDITPLLEDAKYFRAVIKEIATLYKDKVDVVVGIESRGFILASAVAYELGKGLVLIRKKGKLPFEKISTSYDLEYGSAQIEIHSDANLNDKRVLIIDDVLATGGTARASVELIQKFNPQSISLCFLIELVELNGKKSLSNDIKSIMKL